MTTRYCASKSSISRLTRKLWSNRFRQGASSKTLELNESTPHDRFYLLSRLITCPPPFQTKSPRPKLQNSIQMPTQITSVQHAQPPTTTFHLCLLSQKSAHIPKTQEKTENLHPFPKSHSTPHTSLPSRKFLSPLLTHIHRSRICLGLFSKGVVATWSLPSAFFS